MMENPLEWEGPDLVERSSAAEGDQISAMTRGFADLLATARDQDYLLNRVELQRAIEDVEIAYRNAAPIFYCGRFALKRRLDNAGEYGALLVAVSLAELNMISALSRARSAALYRLLHDGDIEEAS
jgi:hypothetical protein